MKKDYKKLFSYLKSPAPPEGLFEKIMFRLEKERKLLTLKRRLVIFSVGLFGSGAAFFPVFKMAWSGLTESGFMDFLSLLFSDAGIVITYWQNFVLSLVETLPVMSLALLLAIVLIFLESLKFLTKDVKSILKPKLIT